MRFARIAGLMICAAMWSSAAVAEQGLADFLKGRWGSANSDWEEVSATKSKYACAVSADGKDSSFRFAGDLANLTVTSDVNRASPGPVTSAVTVGGEVAPEATTGVMQGAAAIVEVSFTYRGLFDTEPAFDGHLGIMSPDRMVLYMRGSFGPWYLVRCKAS